MVPVFGPLTNPIEERAFVGMRLPLQYASPRPSAHRDDLALAMIRSYTGTHQDHVLLCDDVWVREEVSQYWFPTLTSILATMCVRENCVPMNRESLQVHPLVPAVPRHSVPCILGTGNDTLQTPRDAQSLEAMLSCAFLLWLSLIPKILVEMGVVATSSATALSSPHYS